VKKYLARFTWAVMLLASMALTVGAGMRWDWRDDPHVQGSGLPGPPRHLGARELGSRHRGWAALEV